MRKITKKMKKSLSIVLAALMVFSISSSNPSVYAEEPTTSETTEVKMEDSSEAVEKGVTETTEEVTEEVEAGPQFIEISIQNDTEEDIEVSIKEMESNAVVLGKNEMRPFYMEYQKDVKGTIRVTVNGQNYVLNKEDFFATGTILVKKTAEGIYVFDYGTDNLDKEEIVFDHDYADVTEDIDFSTKQLLVGTSNKEVFTSNTNVVSEYDGLYLLQFETVEETRSAYTYYINKVDLIIADTKDFAISEGEDETLPTTESVTEEVTEEVTAEVEAEESDALTELNEALEEKGDMKGTIALIDTGAEGKNIVGAASVIGEDTKDDNGHGTKMVEAILSVNPNAKIYSIKALGEDGKGKISDVYAAIKLATEKKVSVISISASALATKDNELIVDAINEAVEAGIIVVGSAGNNGKNAKYFVPAKVPAAVIVGSADENGVKNADSNFGTTVDFYVTADSTSVATAKMAGYISKYGMPSKSVDEMKIYVGEYTGDESAPTLTDIDFVITETKSNPDTNNWIMSIFRGDNDQAYLTYDNKPAICLLHDASNPSDFDKSNPAVGGYLDVEVSNITDQKVLNLIFWLSASTDDGGLGCVINNPKNPSTNDYTNEFCMSTVLRTYYAKNVMGDVLDTYQGAKRSYAYFNEGLPTSVSYVDDKGVTHSLNVANYISTYQNKAVSPKYTMTAQYLKTGVKLNTAPEGVYGKYEERYQDFVSWSVVKPRDAVYVYKVKENIAADGTRTYEPLKGVTFKFQRRGTNGTTEGGITFNVTTDDNGVAFFAGSNGNGVGFEETDWYAQEVPSTANAEMNYNTSKWYHANSVYAATKQQYNFFYQSGWDTTTYPYIISGTTTLAERYKKASDLIVAKGGRSLTSPASNAYAAINTPKDAKYIYKVDENGKGIAGVIFEVKQDNSTNTFKIITDENGLAVWAGGGAYSTWGESIDGKSGVFKNLGNGLNVNEPGWRARELKCTANSMYDVDDTTWYPMGSLSKKTGHNYSYYLNRWNNSSVHSASSTEADKTEYINAMIDTAVINTTNAKNSIVGEDIYGNGVIQNGEAYVTLVKTSAQPSCTNNNPNYSLTGTEYKIFRSNADATAAKSSKDYSKAVGTLTCKADGTTNNVNLKNYMTKDASTREFKDTAFYVLETKAGKGYQLDSTIYTVTVRKTNQKNNPAKLNVSDKPLLDPIKLDVTKVDAGGNSPEGNGTTLEGAQFTIKYYAVDTSTTQTASTLSKLTPTAKWTIKTIKDTTTNKYEAKLNTSWLTGSDNSSFYYEASDTSKTSPSIPYGYITIEETAAPTGYTLTNSKITAGGMAVSGNVVVGKISDDSGKMYLSTGNAVSGEITVADLPIRPNFSLTKKDENGKAMANVSFKITNTTTKESFTFKTDANGAFTSKGQSDVWFVKNQDGTSVNKTTALSQNADLGALMVGYTYEVKEIRTSANAGYQLEPTITFTVPSNAKATDNFVVKYVGDVVTNVAMPTIGTTAVVTSTSSKILPANSKSEKITDTIKYTNLKADTNFIIAGKLMVVEADGTYKPYQKNGADYVVTKQFKTSASYSKSVYEVDGTTSMDFTIDTTNLDGKKLVVFEKLYLGTTVPSKDSDATQYEVGENIFPVTHEDISNLDQTVYVPTLTSKLLDNKTADQMTFAEADAKVTDTLSYTNLEVGKSYVLRGSLKDAATGAVVKDKAGKDVTIEKTITPTKANDTYKVEFTFDATKVAGKTVVAVQSLYLGNILIASEDDLSNAKQQTRIPTGKTKATDKKTNSHVSLAEKTCTIVDKVSYQNLIADGKKEYTITGTIMDKSTGAPLLDKDGKAITKTETFVPTKSTGVYEMTFTFDASLLGGKTIVIFETCKTLGKDVFVHNDLNDSEQTIVYPSGSTTAMDKATSDKVATVVEGTNITLVDTVHIKNVPVGTYKLQGTLMDKGTKAELTVAGNKVTSDFTVTEAGNVTSKNTVSNVKFDSALKVAEFDIQMNFSIDSSKLYGKDVVVFESCSILGEDGTTYNPVFEHKSINDLGQTVHFTDVKTLATDDVYKGHIGTVSDKAVITEKSMLSNLTYGMEYEVVATLVDQISGNPLKVGDKAITRTAVVTVANDGTVKAVDKDSKAALTTSVTRNSKDLQTVDVTVDIPITYDSSIVSGKKTVVYEDLLHKGVKIRSHSDKNDTGETVNYYQLTLTKTGLDNPKEATFKVKDTKGVEVKFIKVSDGVYNVTTATTGVATINPNAKGTIVLRGFNEGTYAFTETKTEGNHLLLADSFTISFVKTSDTDGTLKTSTATVGSKVVTLAPYSAETPNAIAVEVSNTEVVTLHTGGNGTKAFTMASILLLMIGLILIVARKRKNLILLSLVAMGVLFVPSQAFAKEQLPTVDETQDTTLTIEYDDDMDGKSPVKNAEFTIYKVADLTDEGGYVSLVKEIDYSAAAGHEKELVSDKAVKAVQKELEAVAVVKTDDKGIATATLDFGLFLVVETNPAEFHFASVPFLVTLPKVAIGEDGKPLYNEEGEMYWEYETTAHPKSSTAGNILIQKFVKGNAGDKSKEFHFTVKFDYDGELSYKTNTDKTGKIKSGDTVALKDGEQILIEMVPSGVSFEVTEVEANKDGYTTTVKGDKGRVKRFETSAVFFENYKELPPKTGDNFNFAYLIAFIGSCVGIFGLIMMKRKSSREE